MENTLYEQIRLLANKILQADRQDITPMLDVTRELYEKMTILSYLEGKTPCSEETTTITQEDISMVENEWKLLENEAVLDGKRSSDVIDEDIVVNEDEANDIQKEILEHNTSLVDEKGEKTEEQVVPISDKAEEKTTTKRQKHSNKTDDILQKSLFDQDLFSSEIISFDPDEDIFIETNKANEESDVEQEVSTPATLDDEVEKKTEINIPKQIEESETHDSKKTSFFSFKILDTHEELENVGENEPLYENKEEENDSELDYESAKEEKIDKVEEIKEKQIFDTEHQEILDYETKEEPEKELEEEVEVHPIIEPTVNDVIGQVDEQKLSLNDVLSSKNIVISLNDRLAFINNLFDGEVDDFENTVRYIFSQKDVEVVVEYISEIIKPYYNNWIDKEQYEKRFMNIVIKYFGGK